MGINLASLLSSGQRLSMGQWVERGGEFWFVDFMCIGRIIVSFFLLLFV